MEEDFIITENLTASLFVKIVASSVCKPIFTYFFHLDGAGALHGRHRRGGNRLPKQGLILTVMFFLSLLCCSLVSVVAVKPN